MGINFTKIDSPQNPVIKLVSSLQLKKNRQSEQMFLLEGETLVQEAIKNGIELVYVFAQDEAALNEIVKLVAQNDLAANLTLASKPVAECSRAETEFHMVSEHIMSKISSTDTPPPIIAVAKLFDTSKRSCRDSANSSLSLFLEDISDPGNLGSIIRTGFAAGVREIYLSPNCVDIFNPKVLRASMGSIFYGPVIIKSLNEIVASSQEGAHASRQYQLLATSGLEAKALQAQYPQLRLMDFRDYARKESTKQKLLMLGNEARGLSDEAFSKADIVLQIPMANGIESINVLSAASVLLFGLNKQ